MNDEDKISDEDKIAYANIRGSLAELCRQQRQELEQENEAVIPEDIQEEIEKELETELKEKVLWRKYIRRFSIVVISFLLIGSAVAFGINRGLIFNQFEKNTDIDYAGNKRQKQDELVIYEPKYLPEGFGEESVETDNKTFCNTIYTTEDNSLILFRQQNNTVYNSDSEEIDIEYVSINGEEGYYYIGKEDSVLRWSYDNQLFELKGIPQISLKEMAKIAESINTKESRD